MIRLLKCTLEVSPLCLAMAVNMTLEELKQYKKILLLGFGREGKNTLNFLSHFLPEVEIGIADQKLDSGYLEKQKDYDLIIRSPGIIKKLITKSYTTATNIFFANAKGKIIGITGSKGKSTISSLIYMILKEAGLTAELIGNIGRPMLQTLLHDNSPEKIYVVELSSYQLDDIRYSPHISLWINFFPDHMDYHGGIEEYWRAKTGIISQARPEDHFVYNQDFLELAKFAETVKPKVKVTPFVEDLPFSKDIVPLLGQHNLDNVRAALTVGKILKIPVDIMEHAVHNFKPLPHRLEYVGEYKGIIFYDDAISTTPESTIAAIKSFLFIDTLILGGQDRGYNFSKLAEEVFKGKIPNLILFPDSGERIKQEIYLAGSRFVKMPRIFQTASMEEAVKFVYAHSPAGAICLLSCASPSYTLWKNFEEKGDQFQYFVKKNGE